MSGEVELDYIEDSGPGVAELPAAGEVARDALPAGAPVEPTYPGWEEATVETFLKGTGAGVHMLIGQTENDWLITEKDIERIVPPLTRIANRWEPALRLSPVADPLLVAHGLALYGWRSALEAKRAQRDAEALANTGPGYDTGPGPVGAAVDEDQELDDDELHELEELEHEPYFPR